MNFIAQLINGLSIGSVYALIALGYSMVYGIVKLINFAHGDIIMVGGYAMFVFLKMANMNVFVAVIGSIAFCALAGWLIQRVAYQRLLRQGSPRISLLITALGVSMFLQNLCQLIFGSAPRSMPPIFQLPTMKLGRIPIPSYVFLNILTSIVMMIALHLLVTKSRMGKAMRATSEDEGAAKLMGINTNHVVAFTFIIGSALAGVGAVLYTNAYPNIDPLMGSMPGLKAFVAAVLGGIGSIPGAMIGGFVLGIAESMTKAYISTAWVDAIVFGILIVILLLKPTGILGKNLREKV